MHYTPRDHDLYITYNALFFVVECVQDGPLTQEGLCSEERLC